MSVSSYLPIVVAGPSGVGKSTLLRAVVKTFPDKFGFSVSHTTRDPRPGEENGREYHFVNKDEILKMIDNDEFVEHAIYNGNLYGTSKCALSVLQNEKKIPVLDIDLGGVSSIQKSNFPAKFVFIKPPSIEELRKRLEGRKDTSPEAIENRIKIAINELEERKKYKWDYVLIGDTIEQTFNDFCDWANVKRE